jgi:nucleotide-binding universal stress UspA family protein
MTGKPLYPKVVAGYEENERGEDAVRLGELLAREVGGELRRLHVEDGSPAKELYELAEHGDADLIVLGSTHRASLGRVTPGSVAEHLLTGARCRLAIAPRGYAQDESARERLPVIAVGYDGTPGARAALDEASGLAQRAGATMRVIAVSAPAPPNLGAAAGAPAQLITGDLQETLHHATAVLPTELRALPVHEKGDPGEKLLERAAEGVDLLVLGSRGFGPVMRLMIGSVSARVIREAPCPVMVVPRHHGVDES